MKGFTLIETLVAITILALAVAGPFQALQGALRNSFAARDQLVASSLAQEGIEYVRSVRDGNYLARRSWLTGLAACQPGPCVVDPTQGTVSASIAPLRLTTTGLYTQQTTGGYALTRFTRQVTMTTISTNEVLVTVQVSWQTGGGTFSLSVSENMRDWL